MTRNLGSSDFALSLKPLGALPSLVHLQRGASETIVLFHSIHVVATAVHLTKLALEMRQADCLHDREFMALLLTLAFRRFSFSGCLECGVSACSCLMELRCAYHRCS